MDFGLCIARNCTIARAMATTKVTSAKSPAPGRKGKLFLLILISLLAVIFFANLDWMVGYSRIGTAYGARVACSCHYVGGRSIGDCEKDFEPGMGLLRLSLDEQARSVTASIPLIASATAKFKEGWGCVSVPQG
ncbi:MAG: hypothetical protein U5J78_07485 [Parasphingorhabdus sp.]|nr:hypothetical protein [Parasphingorhabdus sp.]